MDEGCVEWARRGGWVEVEGDVHPDEEGECDGCADERDDEPLEREGDMRYKF